MNLDFSDELKQLRDQARKFLDQQSPSKAVRRVLEGEAPFDQGLWKGVAALGWPGASIPEEYGGDGIGHESVCVLAEQLGASLAPIPFSSSVYLATEAILLFGSEAQKKAYLPKLAKGSTIGCFALAEGMGDPVATRVGAKFRGGSLSGSKYPVADGGIADFAVVAARNEHDNIGLYLVDLHAREVTKTPLKTLDPTRNHARLVFDAVAAEPLAVDGEGWNAVTRLLDRAAVFLAFEQVGGAQRCLDMACMHARDRYAFGRPIGSFQGIKHKLANIFIGVELARSNAYYGAWALSTNAPELPRAASMARVSAIDAYHFAAKENIQTHGGMGFTWEHDCQLYFRRAKLLALELGSARWWKERLVVELEKQNRGA
jgi:hypothetical protein